MLIETFNDYAMLHCSNYFTIMLEKFPIMFSRDPKMPMDSSLSRASVLALISWVLLIEMVRCL